MSIAAEARIEDEIPGLVATFIERHVHPFVDGWEAAGALPGTEIFAELGRLGLLGLNKSLVHGGMGLSHAAHIAFLESLGKCRSASLCLAVCVQTDMATPALAMYGGPRVIEEFLKPSVAGERIASLGVSEDCAGSDIAAIQTIARSDGDDYIISGEKSWVTNGNQASWICLLARTSDAPNGLLNKSLICVPLDTPGVHIARPYEKLGMHASDTTQIMFDEVRVPKTFTVGDQGRGILYQMKAFALERLAVAAVAIGFLERSLEITVETLSERKTFGRPIIANQAVQFRLAELWAKIDQLCSHVRACAVRVDQGEDVTAAAAIAKLTAGRLQREVTDQCLQYHGANGYLQRAEIARMLRDGRLLSIGGGSDEMMLTIIARAKGLPSAFSTLMALESVSVSLKRRHGA